MGWFLAHNSDFLPRGNGVTGRSGDSHGPLGYDCAESTPQAPGGSPARRSHSGSSNVSALYAQILIQGGGKTSPSPRLPWGCSCLERHLRDRSGFARTGSVPGFATRSAFSLPFPHRLRLLPLPPPSPLPVGGELSPSSALPAAVWMWARDKCSAPPLEMDSRYTSAAGIGDLNQLSAAIPATRVEVSVSCR